MLDGNGIIKYAKILKCHCEVLPWILFQFIFASLFVHACSNRKPLAIVM